jgi:hypothetical protein
MTASEKTEDNLITTFGKLRKNAEANRVIEKEDNDLKNVLNHFWVISYGEGAAPYDDDIKGLIREKSLKEHIAIKAQEFRDLGIPYCVLDLFSPLSSWLSKIQKRAEDGSLPIDGGIAVTLNDPRRDEAKIKADERKKLFLVEDDIFKPKANRKLKDYMDNLGITEEGFALVMARPYGGAQINKGEEEFIPVYYSLLRKVWNIVSRHDGEIFCPVPPSLINTALIERWTKLMKEAGASVEFSSGKAYMKITKHLNSKDKLPGLSELGI